VTPDILAPAMAAIANPHLRLDARLVLVAFMLRGDGPPLSEVHVAALCGMSRHQARQAIAALRSQGWLVREWTGTGADRPAPAYRLADGVA
jgi:hypothetical protein